MKDTKQEKALAIFLKNQRLGAVKTRLAAAIGDQKALEIYTRLVALTLKDAKEVSASRHLFYSDNSSLRQKTFRRSHTFRSGQVLESA